jgi:hypothetical protein
MRCCFNFFEFYSCLVLSIPKKKLKNILKYAPYVSTKYQNVIFLVLLAVRTFVMVSINLFKKRFEIGVPWHNFGVLAHMCSFL